MTAETTWQYCDAAFPNDGRRIIILYEDGSGAFLGYWTGETLLDSDGDECAWPQEAGRMWAYLPEGFELWCEIRGEDPFTFTNTATDHAR